jgi:hypothetical protein
MLGRGMLERLRSTRGAGRAGAAGLPAPPRVVTLPAPAFVALAAALRVGCFFLPLFDSGPSPPSIASGSPATAPSSPGPCSSLDMGFGSVADGGAACPSGSTTGSDVDACSVVAGCSWFGDSTLSTAGCGTEGPAGSVGSEAGGCTILGYGRVRRGVTAGAQIVRTRTCGRFEHGLFLPGGAARRRASSLRARSRYSRNKTLLSQCASRRLRV